MARDNYDYECGTCGEQFPSGWRARDQHCEATGHSISRPAFECDCCDRVFGTWTPGTTFRIHACYETFPDEEQRKEHEVDEHYLCAECDRSFMSRHNCLQHLRSRIHQKNGIRCPFCQKDYTTATGVTHHLETGSCPNAAGMNRDTLFNFVRAHDPQGAISKNLIGWHGENKYEATEWAWNGRGYECFYFCHRTFKTLQALNQHLASPVHQQALYHCPNARCAQDFTVLGALVNHLESEKCGAMRFDKVQTGVENLIRTGRMLT